jgi:ABC-2 type transport system permease protein
VWETIGALLDVPAWLLDLSPFHHVGLIPAESFQAGAAAVMVALAAVAAAAAVWAFERRDLAGE